MSQINEYPTEWSYGKYTGSIKDYKGNAFIAKFSPPKPNKQHAQYFTYSKYKKNYPNLNEEQYKQKAYSDAETWCYDLSVRYNTVLNKLRYTAANTIEVIIGSDKNNNPIIMTTDAKHFDLVQKHKLVSKLKKQQNRDISYCFYIYKPKVNKTFTHLLGYKKTDHVIFKNNNPLDCRESNIRITGTVSQNEIVNNDNPDDQFKYYQLFEQKKYDELPRDK